MVRCPGGFEVTTLRGFVLRRFTGPGCKRFARRYQRDRAIGRVRRTA